MQSVMIRPAVDVEPEGAVRKVSDQCVRTFGRGGMLGTRPVKLRGHGFAAGFVLFRHCVTVRSGGAHFSLTKEFE